jgi:hypothetical protein
MQISRHWRIKQQRYRLEGVRFQNGEVSLQNRPAPQPEREPTHASSARENMRLVATMGR